MTQRLAVLGTALIVSSLGVAGCSKTQDTSPGTRIFGSAPVITSVHLDSAPSSVLCDFTEALNFFYGGQMMSPVSIGGTFGHFTLTVAVTDPDSKGPGDLSDILLVSASYVTPHNAEEKTIVLFDDGSPIETDPKQVLAKKQIADPPENCVVGPGDGGVFCTVATYTLLSGDATANDGIYTRKFAFLATPGHDIGRFFVDCIASQNHEIPETANSSVGEVISLRIDVVDKAGNLTTAPARQPFTITGTTTACTGDPCICCAEANGGPTGPEQDWVCRGLPGGYGTLHPDGFCNDPFSF